MTLFFTFQRAMGVGVKFDLERKKMCKVAIAGSQEHKALTHPRLSY